MLKVLDTVDQHLADEAGAEGSGQSSPSLSGGSSLRSARTATLEGFFFFESEMEMELQLDSSGSILMLGVCCC